jgi:DNA-binding transcriptional LysR family regulator
MTKLPDFEGWAVFATVVEERSFAGAARQLGLSVATVSRSITRLEARLGGRLLNRNSRQLAVTEYGRSFVDRATQLFREAAEVESAARELAANPSGTLRVAAPMAYGLRWVAPLVPEFLTAYPDLSLDLHLSDEMVDLVGQGFDAALRIAALPDSSLIARRLCPVKRFIVAAPSYLDRVGRPERPQDLIEQDCLAYALRAKDEVWRLGNGNGGQAAITPRGRLRVTNMEAMVPLVLAGLGVAELPEFIAWPYVQSGRLEVLLSEWSQPQGALYFLTPSCGANPAKVQALRDFCIRRFTKPMWTRDQDKVGTVRSSTVDFPAQVGRVA